MATLRCLPAFSLVVVLIITASASAHGDVRGTTETVTLAPGEVLEFEAGIHYHRLVGTVQGSENGSLLEVLVTGPDGTSHLVAGPGDSMRVNELLPCCKDAIWSDLTVSVRNTGNTTVTAHVDLVLLHDDFAVVAENAEPGAAWQTFLSAVLLAGIPAWIARRPTTLHEEKARRWVKIGSWSLAAAWAGIATLSLIGMARFGGGPLIGSRVAMAPLPMYGTFVNSYLLVAIPLAALWVISLTGWVVAERRSHDPRALGAHRLAYAAGIGPLAFGLLFAVEVGNVPLALLLGVVPAALILTAVLMPHRARAGT